MQTYQKEQTKAKPATGPGKTVVIRSIDFVGNRKYKDKTLRKKLGFDTGDYLDKILAQTYTDTIREFYKGKGFALVKVSIDSEKLKKGDVVYYIEEGPIIEVKSVSVEGNKSIKTSALKKILRTDQKRWFVLPGNYSPEKVAEDLDRLKTIYYTKGFLSPRITVVVAPDILDPQVIPTVKEKNKVTVNITFRIDEGPEYTVRDIIFTGNKQLDEETLRSGLPLQKGQVYREKLAVSHAEKLQQLYRQQGFIDAQVELLSPEFVSGVTSVNVEFKISEGQQFRIGRIDITGNEHTQDKVVRRVLDEYGFTPGQLYNADIAPKEGGGELEKQVQRTTLAEETIIRPVGEPYVYDQTKQQKVLGQDVAVGIKEGQTGMIMAGGGISADSGIIGRVIWEQRNFDIKDWPKSLGEFVRGEAFKGAGQTLKIALEPGTDVSQYSVDFTDPYWKDKPISLDVLGLSWERWRESYDEGRTKGQFVFEKRYKNEWRRSIGFRLENVTVHNVDSEIFWTDPNNVAIGYYPGAPKTIVAHKGDNLLVGLKVGIGRDLRDDKLHPTSGYTWGVNYEQLAGEEIFGIVNASWVRYKTIHTDLAERKTILATKLLAGTVLGDAPPFEKFYAGGSGYYGIRGFDYRGVSKRSKGSTTLWDRYSTQGGAPFTLPTGGFGAIPWKIRKKPIGSDWLFLANAEVAVPLVGNSLSVLFFVDSGAVETGGYRAAAGTGLQIMIPQWFGPVPMRLELATPFMKDDDDETRAFSFSVGALF